MLKILLLHKNMLLLFFISLIFNGAVSEKFICTLNHTVKLEPDKVIFFESPNFPRIMTDDEMNQCFLNFTKTLSIGEKNKRFVFATSNTLCDQSLTQCPNIYESINFTLFYEMNNEGDFYGYQALQGFAYFDDWGDDCPLESVSRVQPFHFTDITQILVIRSTFDPTKPRNQSCLWQFKAPKDFGFKIVITFLQIENTTIFKVENTQDIIITPANVRTTYPHYTVDKYIKIYLSENLNKTFLPMDDDGEFVPELTAYVTIIKNNMDHFTIHCPVEINGNSTFWSYWNDDQGYPNNAECTYSMKILPNTEVIAFQNKMTVETNVDVINYYNPNNSLPLQDFDNQCFFTDGKNEKDILWEFISDGTVQSRGFEIQFDTKYCSCADALIIVPCTGEINRYLMNNDDDPTNNFNNFYCGNLECNFTIVLHSSCSAHFISISFEFTIFEYDVFRIYSNNLIVYEINNQNLENNPFITRIPSENYNILQTITTPSSTIRALTLTFSALNIYTNLPAIIINETKPYYFYETCVFNDKLSTMIRIELTPDLKQRNATIDIFVFDEIILLDFSFYKDLSHQLNLQNCFVTVTDSVMKCKTNLNSFSFAQFVKHTCNVYFIFQASDPDDKIIGAKGCVFKNHVLNFAHPNENEEISQFTVMSNKKQKCKIFFYSFFPFYFCRIWMSPNLNDSLNIYAGIEENLFAAINSNTSLLWKDLYFVGNIYIIEIPLNSATMISSYYISKPIGTAPITSIANDPYITVVISPNYGNSAEFLYSGSNYDCGVEPFRIFSIKNTNVSFKLLNFDVLSPNVFYFLKNDTQINITSTFNSVIFEPSEVELHCSCPSNVHCNIRILVETIELNETDHFKTSTKALPTLPFKKTTQKSSSSFISTVNYFLLMLVYSTIEFG